MIEWRCQLSDVALCTGVAPQVWVANGHSLVKKMDSSSSDTSRRDTLPVDGHILRIAYDHSNDRVFWIDSSRHVINM